ncbi:MAG TPA: endonuclease domain-containing protein [Chitinophagaceae bacterium]|nr:endonuclease domain-containing protein [Chitinophagaceae bacterium]
MSTNMHYGATQEIFQIAERLRKNMTEAEKVIWEQVCKNQLGVRIRRQHPIWKFIADFYCHELRLVVEIDGGIHLHNENKEYDISRDEILRDFKLEILRFTNNEVINETDRVIEEIKRTIVLLKMKQMEQPDKEVKAG